MWWPQSLRSRRKPRRSSLGSPSLKRANCLGQIPLRLEPLEDRILLSTGVSSAVAGAEVTQEDAVFYKVNASNGTVDEYVLYQAVVDPALGLAETEGNDTVSQADLVTTSTIVTGVLDADDIDFFRFESASGSKIAVVLDNDPDNDGQYANTSITLYDSNGTELSSNVSFSDGHAVGGVEVPFSLFPVTYYVAVADNGFGDDTDYQFVVIEAPSEVGEDQAKTIEVTTSPNETIPDYDPANPTNELVSSVMIDMGNSFAHPDDVQVKLNITHSFDEDLDVYLESPSGIIVELFTDVGGSGDNFTNTALSDSAAFAIHAGPPFAVAPFTGTYRPEGNLSDFTNDTTNGEWRLHVRDDSPGDQGTLVDWTLTLTVRTNESPDMADTLGVNQSADGRVPSGVDMDFFKVQSGTIDVGDRVFAYVDTQDTDQQNADQNDSFLTVLAADGTTVLDENDDHSPVAPTVAAASSTVTVDEDATAANTGRFGHPDGDTVSLSASVGTIADNGNGTWSWSFDTTDGTDDSQTVTITASGRGAAGSTTFALTVNNVAPIVVAANATVTVDEGATAANTGTFSDPGDDTVGLSASVGAIVDNGNGTWSWSLGTTDGTDDSQTVTITATDSDGVQGTTTFDLVVDNVAPSVAADSVAVMVNEGDTATNIGTFGDAGNDTVSLSAAVGSITDNGNGTWSWSLGTTDGTDDSQTVTVTATDSDGTPSSTTFALIVNNVGPAVAADSAMVMVDEGATAVNSGTFSDPGDDTIALSASVGTVADNGNGTWRWSFETSDGPDDSQLVTIAGTDSDGAASHAAFGLAVTNVAPTLSVAGNQTVDEGATLTITDLGAFTDPAFADPNLGNAKAFTYSIDWGDGTAPDQGVPTIDQAGSTGVLTRGSLDGSHIYADDGPYTVSVTVTDDDGHSDTETFRVTVANVTPTLSVVGKQTIAQGVPLSITDLSTFTDPAFADPSLGNAKTFMYSIDWGDGTAPDTGSATIDQMGGRGVPTAGSIDGSHAYADTSEFIVTVTVTDDDGGSGSESFGVRAYRVLGPNESYTYTDADGDEVTIHFGGGAGSATVGRQTTPGDLDQIVLEGTNEDSWVTVHVSRAAGLGWTTIGSITGSGLGRFHGPAVDIVGNTINLTGPMHTLIVRDIEDGSDITLAGNTTDELTLVVRNIGDVDLTFPGVLTSATLHTWDDGNIDVNYIGRLTQTDSSGTFGADLDIADRHTHGWSLASADIAGDVTSSTWDAPGDLGQRYRWRSRWYTHGIHCAGDFEAALTVGGQAWLIDINGQLQGAVDVGSSFAGAGVGLYSFSVDDGSTVAGTLTVHGSAGVVQFGDFRALTGQADGAIKIEGSVNRIVLFAGTGPNGTVDVAGDLGRLRSRRRTEGLHSDGDVRAALTVGGQAWLIDINGQLQGAVDVGSSFAGAGAALHSFSADGGSTAAGTLTVHGSAGVVQFGDFRKFTGRADGAIKIEGNVNRVDLYAGSAVSGTIDVQGDLGRRYRRRRRWRTEGLYSGGDLRGALTVDGQGWLIDINGQLQGAVDVGSSFASAGAALHGFSADGGSTAAGTLTVHGSAGVVQFGDFRALTGRADGAIKIEGNVNRVDLYAGSGVSGTIDVEGDLGRRYRRKRRWRTEGLYCGGDLKAALTVGGEAWLIEVDGEMQGMVEIDDSAGSIYAEGGVSGGIVVGKNPDPAGAGVHLAYFSCGGNVTGDLTVHGDAKQVYIAGDLSANITADGGIGYRYRRRGRWRQVGVTIVGKFIGNAAPAIRALDDADGSFVLAIGDGAYQNGLQVLPAGSYRPLPTLYWNDGTVLAQCL